MATGLLPPFKSSLPVASDARPNPYISMDRLLANSSLDFKPFVNFPPKVMQFSNSDKSRLMREEGRDRATSFGKIFPNDRHVVANDTVRV